MHHIVICHFCTLRNGHHEKSSYPAVQAGFRKGRGTRYQIAIISWIMEKEASSRKTSFSALLTMPKPLTVWITINCGKLERDGNTRPPDLPLEKPICRSGSNSYNWTWNNRLVPNRKKSTSRLYIDRKSTRLNSSHSH